MTAHTSGNLPNTSPAGTPHSFTHIHDYAQPTVDCLKMSSFSHRSKKERKNEKKKERKIKERKKKRMKKEKKMQSSYEALHQKRIQTNPRNA